jgi:hypothetical protein
VIKNKWLDKNNEIMSFARKCMELSIIILGEINQSHSNTAFFSHVESRLKKKKDMKLEGEDYLVRGRGQVGGFLFYLETSAHKFLFKSPYLELGHLPRKQEYAEGRIHHLLDKHFLYAWSLN